MWVSLSVERLSTLLHIKVEGKPWQNYASKAAVDLFYGEKNNDRQKASTV